MKKYLCCFDTIGELGRFWHSLGKYYFVGGSRENQILFSFRQHMVVQFFVVDHICLISSEIFALLVFLCHVCRKQVKRMVKNELYGIAIM